jgi:predicted nucleic acid-binding protein
VPFVIDASLTLAWCFEDQQTNYSEAILATRHRLSTYDASYLELALRLGLPLATTDKRLRAAARAAGVALAQPSR